ncbi:unnamed protein product, partial [Meganyctiphanes norvegica]
MGPNGINGLEYCRKGANKSDCENRKWHNPNYNERPEIHPYWCAWSSGFIIGPSILTNLMLLTCLLYKFSYRRHFITAGLHSLANMHRLLAFLSLSTMAVFQILPLLGMVLKILVTWRIYQKKIDEGEDSNELKFVTTMINTIFSYTEDLP